MVVSVIKIIIGDLLSSNTDMNSDLKYTTVDAGVAVGTPADAVRACAGLTRLPSMPT